MKVIKRNGEKEDVQFDKITKRIECLSEGLNEKYVIKEEIAKKVISGLYDGVTTEELDHLASETCASMGTIHPDFIKLASNIEISNLHKKTESSFLGAMKKLRGSLSYEFMRAVAKNHAALEKEIDYNRDFYYDYFGFKTLEKSYLLRSKGEVIERPQHMLMRVSLAIHIEDIDKALETYDLLSNHWFIHATPTLYNAGTIKPSLSSCYLLTMQDDSIEGIYNTLKQCALISQSAGGIGLSIHNVRSSGSYIRGTNGISNGIVPMLRNFDMTGRYVDQGGGKRKGSFAIYLEPWHSDIQSFLELKKNHGKEELRARDLFYGLWIPDLFMKRIIDNKKWSLFSPDQAKGLQHSYGYEFEELYEKYEKLGLAREVIEARELWNQIVVAQIETGTPYMLYKDQANKKSNQRNCGTILSSNLCTEIIEFTSKDEIAVCNLASISLKKFVGKEFDHQKLYEVTKTITKNLNRVIDITEYPLEEARRSNLRHRPIGIGVQGLADVFMMMRLPFDSSEAKELNKEIFETIYFGAMEASMEEAKEKGYYDSYIGSPLSEGSFQFDLWFSPPGNKRWDWDGLKKKVKEYGARNSLLLAPMPTASTSQILGSNECFEPVTSNMYTRRTLSGEFIMSNEYLMKDLIRLNLWNDEMRNKIILHNGSIQNIEEIPDDIKELYKTVWEISQKTIIDMAADRGIYVCQSQSMNIFLKDATIKKVSSMHFYAWKKGLKTGMYYLRTQAATDAIKFTIPKECKVSNDCDGCGS